MIRTLLAALSWKQRLVFAGLGLLIVLAIFGAGYATGHIKGSSSEQISQAKTQTKQQSERADNAEIQRDIANAPPASVDDMLDWLHPAEPASRK